jgi:hypothetical protein
LDARQPLVALLRLRSRDPHHKKSRAPAANARPLGLAARSPLRSDSWPLGTARAEDGKRGTPGKDTRYATRTALKDERPSSSQTASISSIREREADSSSSVRRKGDRKSYSWERRRARQKGQDWTGTEEAQVLEVSPTAPRPQAGGVRWGEAKKKLRLAWGRGGYRHSGPPGQTRSWRQPGACSGEKRPGQVLEGAGGWPSAPAAGLPSQGSARSAPANGAVTDLGPQRHSARPGHGLSVAGAGRPRVTPPLPRDAWREGGPAGRWRLSGQGAAMRARGGLGG